MTMAVSFVFKKLSYWQKSGSDLKTQLSPSRNSEVAPTGLLERHFK